MGRYRVFFPPLLACMGLLLAGAETSREAGDDPSDAGEAQVESRAGERIRAPVQRRSGAAEVGSEVDVSAVVRTAVLNNELLQRLSVASRVQSLTGSPPGGGRWQKEALGEADAVPVTVGFSRALLRVMALKDGSRIWLGSGHVDEAAAVLRLGDLLPLVSVVGINDRDLALAASSVSFGGGATPPAYTMTFQTGSLWPHKRTLLASERSGRVVFSFVTGRMTVLGALVLANADGELAVRRVSPKGDHVNRYKDLAMPRLCKPLEDALRGDEPPSAMKEARELLQQASLVQACAARYLALAAPSRAPDYLRTLLSSGRVAQPAEVVEALAYLEPEVSQRNLAAVASMIQRNGAVGAEAVCHMAPALWSHDLLEREDVSEANKNVIRRCLRP